jgi:hypothetical protein
LTCEGGQNVFRWTRELGIGTNAYYLIGNPGETREEIEEGLREACGPKG